MLREWTEISVLWTENEEEPTCFKVYPYVPVRSAPTSENGNSVRAGTPRGQHFDHFLLANLMFYALRWHFQIADFFSSISDKHFLPVNMIRSTFVLLCVFLVLYSVVTGIAKLCSFRRVFPALLLSRVLLSGSEGKKGRIRARRIRSLHEQWEIKPCE